MYKEDLIMLGLTVVAGICGWKLFKATDKWLEQRDFERLDRTIKFYQERGFSKREISNILGTPYNEFGVSDQEEVSL